MILHPSLNNGETKGKNRETSCGVTKACVELVVDSKSGIREDKSSQWCTWLVSWTSSEQVTCVPPRHSAFCFFCAHYFSLTHSPPLIPAPGCWRDDVLKLL